MKTLLILNGPNLNLLGTREPQTYGGTTLGDVEAMCREAGAKLGCLIECLQSNHEGVLIDAIHDAGKRYAQGTHAGIVFNAGAYTHTSIALHDAIKGVAPLPVVEVHISNVYEREAFRHHSYIGPACIAHIIGKGVQGYVMGMDALAAHAAKG